MYCRCNPTDEENWMEQLRWLEADYFNTPVFMRRNDLKSINALRQKLKLPEVDSNLHPILSVEPPLPAQQIAPAPKKDPHVEARGIYQAYLDKLEMMRPHQEYCDRMIEATGMVGGKTPVMPLAIMGTDGGPLLCDTCKKQIPLEGGSLGANWQGIGAGTAWATAEENEMQPDNTWCSFISGGVTFVEEYNRTFRVYHGYEGGCLAKDPKNKQEAAFVRKEVPYVTRQKLSDFLAAEHGIQNEAERKNMINTIFNELYKYDPGIGVNHP